MANWSPLRGALTRIEESVTYAWADLDALVGGLPPSAYAHSAFWAGARSGWPGFRTTNVRVGEEVTFVRQSARSARHEFVEVGSDVRTDDRPADLILVACVKQKLNHLAPARDLYTSDLFGKERAYAERSRSPWFILSARHGLVDPDVMLEPYDLHLSKTSAAYRNDWGTQVIEQLQDAVGPLDGRTIELHAGSAYANAIRNELVAKGALMTEPLKGLSFGHRLAWYRRSLDGGTNDA